MSRTTLPALALLLLAGCASRDPAPEPPRPDSPGTRQAPSTEAEHTRVLRLDQPVQLDEQLEIVWLKLNDSRCPVGVTCVWAGDVTLSLEATEKGREPTRLELALRPGAEEAASATLNAWQLQLLSVDPYPRDGVRTEREDFRAAITVSRLD